MSDELLTAKQVAKLAGCHISYLQRARRLGEVDAVKSTIEVCNGITCKVYWYTPDTVETMRDMKAHAKENRKNRRVPSQAVRMCSKPHLAGCDKLPNPYPCTRFDLENACKICGERYRTVSSGTSSGWTAEQIGAGRIR